MGDGTRLGSGRADEPGERPGSRFARWLVVLILALAWAPGTLAQIMVAPAPADLPWLSYYREFSHQFTASGGKAPYLFELTSGPSWVELSPDGVLSSTRPTPADDPLISFIVTDAEGTAESFSGILPISHRIYADPYHERFPAAETGKPYVFTTSGRDGKAPYVFALVSGPEWLTLDADGRLHGVPPSAGSSYVSFTITDATGRTDQHEYLLRVEDTLPVLTLLPEMREMPQGTVGESYEVRFAASGGDGLYEFFAETSLPKGLSLTREGLFSGITLAKGANEFTVRVQDRGGASTRQTYSLNVINQEVEMVPAGSVLPDAHVGGNYEQFIRVAGDLGEPGGPYLYRLKQGPPGLTMWTHNGRLFGIPTEAGSSVVHIEVARYSDFRTIAEFSYELFVAEPDYRIVLSPEGGALPAGIVGVPYSQMISAEGGQGEYRFKFLTQSGVGGIGINEVTGEISGSPYWEGEYAFTVEVEDEQGYSARQSYTISVAPRPDTEPISIGPDISTLTRPIVGEPYSVTFTAEGGLGEYDFYIDPANLPPGLEFDPQTATLSGIAEGSGNYAFMLRVRDALYNQGFRSYSIAPRTALSIRPPNPLLPAKVGQAYPEFQYFYGDGGDGNFAFEVTGALPAGMQFTGLDSRFPMLGGTPTEFGSFDFALTVRDHGPFPVTETFSIEVAPRELTITTATLPDGRVGAPYTSPPLTVVGGSGPPSFSVSTGELPPGLTLDGSTGVISGVPTEQGSGSFTIEVRDSGGVGQREFAIAIAERAVIGLNPSAGTLPEAWIGYPYDTAIMPVAPGATGVVMEIEGELPPGLAFDAGRGVIEGIPVSGGTFEFTVSATDPAYGEGSATYSLAVTDAPVWMYPSPGALPTMRLGKPTTVTVAFYDTPAGAYSYALTGALPAGVAWDSATGTASGTPTESGTFTFDVTPVRVVDGKQFGPFSYEIKVQQYLDLHAVLPVGFVGEPYYGWFTIFYATGNYVFELAAGDLPDGITFEDGMLSGTPTETGLFPITVHAYEEHELAGRADVTLDIRPLPDPVQIVPAEGALPEAWLGEPYSLTFQTIGGAPTYYFLSIELPPGLELDMMSGELSGTPSQLGTFDIELMVYDHFGMTQGTYALTVSERPAVPDTSTSVTLAPNPSTLGEEVTITAQVVPSFGSAVPHGLVRFDLPGDVQRTATLDSEGRASIVTSDLPLGRTMVTVSYLGTDAFHASDADTEANVVAPDVEFIWSPPSGTQLASAMVGEDYATTVAATGGVAPVTYTLVGGDLPAGVTFDASGVAGTPEPDAHGSYEFTISAQDRNGSVGTASYTLEVVDRQVSVIDHTITVPEGSSPPPVDLTEGATGGPFYDGLVVSIDPPHAGTARITTADTDGFARSTSPRLYLHFKPIAGFSGTAKVGYRLVSALGTSDVGFVTFLGLAFDDDEVRRETEAAVRDFVSTRDGLVSSAVRLPGLADRRGFVGSDNPVTAGLADRGDGVSLDLATSTSRLFSQRGDIDVWVNATHALFGLSGEGRLGTFSMLSSGIDTLIGEHLLVGMSLHLDQISDPTRAAEALEGLGWMVGPYVSAELGEGVFFDASLLYGGSVNRVDAAVFDGQFTTGRLRVDARLNGAWMLGDTTRLRPRLEASYTGEWVDGFVVTDGDVGIVEIEGFSVDRLRLGIGATLEHSVTLNGDLGLTPRLSGDLDLSGFDTGALRGSASLGVTVSSGDWSVDTSLDLGGDTTGLTRIGGQLGLQGRF
jgi:hypothetical protein